MPIRLLAPNDPALNAYQAALAEHNPYDIELHITPFAEYRAALDACLNAEQATHHIVFVPGHLWIPELVHAKKLYPLDPIFSDLSSQLTDYEPETLLPLVADEARYEGVQYMVPLFSDGHILFYDPTLVTLPDAIVNPADILHMVIEVAKQTDRHPIALKAHPAEIFLDWLPYLLAVGGDVLTERGQPGFNMPAGVLALESYIQLAHYAPDATHRYGNEEIADALMRGSVAMAVTWGGQAAPIWFEAGSIASERYRVAPLKTPWNATWGAAIPANLSEEDQRVAAQALLDLNKPDMDVRVLHDAGSPIRQTSYTEENLASYPWLAAQQHMLNHAVMLPKLPAIGQVLGTLYDNVYQAFRGKKSATEALTDAEQAVLNVLAG